MLINVMLAISKYFFSPRMSVNSSEHTKQNVKVVDIYVATMQVDFFLNEMC